MRILLLSDIHSNLEALEACLTAAPLYHAAVNLGDIVGYGASPNDVSRAARELGGTFVRGNHDKVVAGIDSAESFNPIAGIAAAWNREQLSADNLDWLRALPQGPVAGAGFSDVQYVHGASDDEDRYVITLEDAFQQLVLASVGITFFGHTHVQGGFASGQGLVEEVIPEYATVGKQETWDFHLVPGVTYLINPGSVGQPRDGDWRAGFAVFDSDERVVTFCRTPYNLRLAQQKIFDAGLPAMLATRLAAGR